MHESGHVASFITFLENSFLLNMKALAISAKSNVMQLQCAPHPGGHHAWAIAMTAFCFVFRSSLLTHIVHACSSRSIRFKMHALNKPGLVMVIMYALM